MIANIAPAIISSDRPIEEDPIFRLLTLALPWMHHGALFSEQLLGAGPWPDQGWKLHVSATALSALTVLERALPILQAEGVRFKAVNGQRRLLRLNCGEYGPSQVGKFITVYPSDDDQAVRLAVTLDEATRGQRGPRVPTDRPLRPGSLVHYRYGGFRARPEGCSTPGSDGPYGLLDPEGRLAPDHRLQFYISPAPGIIDPFEAQGAYVAPPARSGPLAGRFLVVELLGRASWGGVYQAIDLSVRPPCVCTLKEAWRDVALDTFGRDASDWLAHEADLLTRYAGNPVFPRCHTSFTLDGNHYIANEYVDGQSLLAEIVARQVASEPLSLEEIVAIGREAGSLLAQLHAVGVVYRDFKPANVIRSTDGRLRMIDFGTAYEFRTDTQPPFSMGTPPYYSEQQFSIERPHPSDDVFAWGAVLHELVCGLAPRPASAEREGPPAPTRLPPVSQLQPAFPAELATVIDRALAWERADRYQDMAEALADFSRAADALPTKPAGPAIAAVPEAVTITNSDDRSPLDRACLVGDALCAAAEPRADGLCWAAQDEFLTEPTYGSDLYSGAAGIALFLAELASATGEQRYADAARGAARWLAGPEWGRGRAMPGLYVGDAGIGLFFVRLAAALDEPGYVAAAELCARRLTGVVHQTIDLLHGTAGTILFLLELARASGNRAYRQQACVAAESLLERARPAADGGTGCYWIVPSDTPGQDVKPWAGLMHGSAGIALALSELGCATGDERFIRAADAAAELLLRQAVVSDGRGWRWPGSFGDEEPSRQQAMCHGAGGIGMALLRMSRRRHDIRYEAAASQAARAMQDVVPRRAYSGCCHGLAGDGGFFLDCYQQLHDATHLEYAWACARLIESFRLEDSPGRYRLNRRGSVSPDLMMGYAGIGAFYLRLSAPAVRPDLILS